MATPEVIHYIKSELERGVNREVIKATLLKNGWEQELINESFHNIDSGETPNPTPMELVEQEPNKGTSVWVKVLIALGVLAVLTPFIIIFTSLSSLDTSRSRANDSEIKSVVAQLLPEAKMYASDNNDTYVGTCDSDGFEKLIAKISERTTVKCFDNKDTWAASAILSDNTYHCLDSTGYTGASMTELASGKTVCPDGSSTTPGANTQHTGSNTPEELKALTDENNTDSASKNEQTTKAEGSSSSATTPANLKLDVKTNYQGNPLRALITCTSNQEMSSWAVASGIPGKVDMSASIGVSSGAQKIVEETYISPGTYTVVCSGTTLSGKELVAKKEISIGGGTSQGKVSFTAGSTSGNAPFSTPVTCDYSETVTSISIDYYTPEEMAVIWGEVFAGESDMDIEDMSLTTRISSKGFDEPVSSTFTADEPGTYNLYCTVGLADMTSTTTGPIIITVK